MKPLFIVIPFYKNPNLAGQIGEHFLYLVDELKQAYASFIFVNDSPDDVELSEALEDAGKKLIAQGLQVEHIKNEVNQGFVISTNRGLLRCIEKNADALLLNSDALLAPGALLEMRRVAALDPMFGIVCPRSNNATICSIPFEERSASRTYEEALKNFGSLWKYLPEFQVIPTGVGFCLLVKHAILQEFGVLDEIYSPGYNEENDFCFRINRCGYSVILANRAFAFHDSSSSFGEDERALNDARNRPVLLERYGEYDRAVAEYFASPTFKFEHLLGPIVFNDNILTVAVDFHHFRYAHNGTYEFGKLLLHALYNAPNRNFHLAIICDDEMAAFHDLEAEFPALARYPSSTDKKFDIALKPAQPFELGDLNSLSNLARYNFVIMLDTIANDCAYIRGPALQYLWSLTAKTMDGILFISTLSKDLFARRFPEALNTPLHACQLSVHEHDYLKAPTPEVRSEFIPKMPFILVLGNHYEHKYLKPTLERLSKEFPDELFVALGGEDSIRENIQIIKSGNLSTEQIDNLYWYSKMIVFPSHYEGFGFPVPHGLARKKTVIARRSPLNEEIGDRWIGGGTLRLFEDYRDMLSHVRETLAETSELSRSEITPPGDDLRTIYDWQACATLAIDFIKKVVKDDPTCRRGNLRVRELGFNALIDVVRAEVAEKEKERVHVSNLLHQRNLEYLALRDLVTAPGESQ